MRRRTAAFTPYFVLAAILTASTAFAQNDVEDPNLYEGAWYRIALDEDGAYIVGDGDGYAQGTWYYYPEADGAGWWRQWFYNGPCDSNRKGQLDYQVYIKAADASLRTTVEVRFNWATPEWSALGKRRPPLPSDVTTEDLEAQYMQGRDLHCVDNWYIGTIEPIKSHTVSEYNPEWVSVDIRGHNAYVYRGAYHSCVAKNAAMGACYNEQTGDCYTGYESDCDAPYVWLGMGSSCADYVVPGAFPVPVYRFWSPVMSKHFFTTSEREKDSLIEEGEGLWSPEGVAFYAFMADEDPNCLPVYRFWSESLGVYFYTITETEKDKLREQYSAVWSYEGPAFYAYPVDNEPSDAVPVYRFWSGSFGYHFFTISEKEKDKLIADYPDVWAYEGVAWYAYQP